MGDRTSEPDSKELGTFDVYPDTSAWGSKFPNPSPRKKCLKALYLNDRYILNIPYGRLCFCVFSLMEVTRERNVSFSCGPINMNYVVQSIYSKAR